MGRNEVFNINWKDGAECEEVLRKLKGYMFKIASEDYGGKGPYGVEDYVQEASIKLWLKGRAPNGKEGFYKSVIRGAMRDFHKTKVLKVNRAQDSYISDWQINQKEDDRDSTR
jgi:DNA-directed RNA polymerase specialized sigma24 family protein